MMKDFLQAFSIASLFVFIFFGPLILYKISNQELTETWDEQLVAIEMIEQERNDLVLALESEGSDIDFTLIKRPEFDDDLKRNISKSESYITDVNHDISRLKIRLLKIEKEKNEVSDSSISDLKAEIEALKDLLENEK